MKTVSQLYKTTQGYGFALKLEAMIEGESRIFTYDDLLSFKFAGNGSSNEALTFGYVSACEISFGLDNITGQWDNISLEGVEWVLSLGKNLSWDPDDEEVFQIGIFTTTEALEVDGAINVKATDGMVKFDKRFHGINFPCTLHDLVLQCCKQCGVTFLTSSYTNMDFVISGAYQLTQLTCRKIISLVAELCGKFAIINSHGELEFRWFNSTTPVIEFNADDVTGFKPDKASNIVGGTSVTFNGTEYAYGIGSKKITLTSDHRLLMYCTPEEIQDLLVSIYNDSESMLIFSTASFSAIGEPALDIGDTVSIVDRKGRKHNILVSGFTLSGNLKMDVVSPGIATEDASTSPSTESGSIPRETSESVNSFIARSERVSLSANSTSQNFLYQRFSSESGAAPVLMATIVGMCSTPGILDVLIIVDGSALSVYSDNVITGPYLKTIICPLEGLIAGNHTVEIQLISDNTLSIIFPNEESPSAGSVMIIQGRKLSEPATWDGVVTVADVFNRISVRDQNMIVRARDEFNSIVTNESPGPVFCQTISINISRPQVRFAEARIEVSTTLK